VDTIRSCDLWQGASYRNARYMEAHMKISHSAQPYAISEEHCLEQLCKITDAEAEPKQVYLHDMAKAAQQKLHFC